MLRVCVWADHLGISKVAPPVPRIMCMQLVGKVTLKEDAGASPSHAPLHVLLWQGAWHAPRRVSPLRAGSVRVVGCRGRCRSDGRFLRTHCSGYNICLGRMVGKNLLTQPLHRSWTKATASVLLAPMNLASSVAPGCTLPLCILRLQLWVWVRPSVAASRTGTRAADSKPPAAVGAAPAPSGLMWHHHKPLSPRPLQVWVRLRPSVPFIGTNTSRCLRTALQLWVRLHLLVASNGTSTITTRCHRLVYRPPLAAPSPSSRSDGHWYVIRTPPSFLRILMQLLWYAEASSLGAHGRDAQPFHAHYGCLWRWAPVRHHAGCNRGLIIVFCAAEGDRQDSRGLDHAQGDRQAGDCVPP